MQTIDTTQTVSEFLDMLEAEFFKPDEGSGRLILEANFERNGLRFELEIKEVYPEFDEKGDLE